MDDDMTPVHDVLMDVIAGYQRAMARFDGEPCAECGDAFDHKQSNYFPIWSDKHDNLICMSCHETLDNQPTIE